MEIVLLDNSHDRSKFNCEEESLTAYIQKQASQDVKKGLAVCFVVANDAQEVIGYYTLSSASLAREGIPEPYIRKLPYNYSAPVTLLGRLARDITQKGTGIGEHLLIDALARSHRISKKGIGSMAVIVDPISDQAVSFYQKYGFIKLPDSGKMFLPMKTIGKLFG